MAQINKPSEYFNTLLYTATGVQSVTGAGFQPDMSWVKARSTTSSHYIADVVRGSTKTIKSNSTDAEGTIDLITSFDSDGVTLGSANWSDSRTAVIWNWLADNTSGSSNTDGSITSTVSASTTSGFSIVSYTGTGANATVGHGLGTSDIGAIIFKNRTDVEGWKFYHKSLGATQNLNFNETGAAQTQSGAFNDTEPTSSVFSVGTFNSTNGSSDNMIAYCFAEKKGYSKFGSYTGNGSTDGTFVYTGFKPAMVIIKASSGVADWYILDNKRDPENVVEAALRPNLSNAESTTINDTDFLSNGFKTRSTSGSTNGSGTTYIYMAFAENPLVGTNNIPATAR